MKKFLIRLLIFCLFFYAIDKLFIFVQNTAPPLEVDRRLEYIIQGKIQSDVVILGSSRGARSVIAKQFVDSLGVSAYNLAFPGSDVTFHEFVLRTLLQNKKNKKPKTIILVVDDGDEVKTSKSLKFRLDRLYPLTKYKVVRDELEKRKEKKPIVNELLVLHQINKSNFLFKKQKFTKNDSIFEYGSMPIGHQKKTFDKVYGKVPYTYDAHGELTQKKNAFKALVKLCKENKIQLIVAIPPNFRKISLGFPERMKALSDGYAIVWKYDESDPVYQNPDFFFDNAHLQTKGSIFYTAELVKFYRSHQPN